MNISAARFVGPVILAITGVCLNAQAGLSLWNHDEIATLRSLWIGSLPPLPRDPGNAVADDPRAASLGQRLFFDTRFSANGQVACATCHQAERNFKDSLPRSQGMDLTQRKAMTIVGVAYSPWFFWDGRKDSLWAQALAPLESAAEHGGTRMQYTHLIARDKAYRTAYEALFGPLPELTDTSRFPASAGPAGTPDERAAWEAMSPEDRMAVTRVYANLGKAIAAYERLLLPGPAAFDRYIQALLNNDEQAMAAALSPEQIAGLRLFIGKAQCIDCHNGPLFTNNDFHNTGLAPVASLPLDQGRMAGVRQAQADEFNCLGNYSDAGEGDCAELRFAKTSGRELVAAFKTPTLRNVADTGPYNHDGRFATLRAVLEHYNRASPVLIGHELQPLDLSEIELTRLEAFLHSLTGPLATPPEWLAPMAKPTVRLHRTRKQQ